MTRTGLLARKIVDQIVAVSKNGTPIRVARGVVVSSTIGQTQVTIDGGATQIPAFNLTHAQSFAASTVVEVLLVGRKAIVLGSYGNDAPVGGVVAQGFAGATSDVTSGTSPFTLAAPVVKLVVGHVYLLQIRAQAAVITASPSFTNVTVSDSASLIAPNPLYVYSANSPVVGQIVDGSTAVRLVPASTATDTITIIGNTSGSGGTRFSNAKQLEYVVTRIA